jgi:hypothetical protein
MAVANTLANYITATLTAVKSFIVQAPGDNVIKLFGVINALSGAIRVKSLDNTPMEA